MKPCCKWLSRDGVASVQTHQRAIQANPPVTEQRGEQFLNQDDLRALPCTPWSAGCRSNASARSEFAGKSQVQAN